MDEFLGVLPKFLGSDIMEKEQSNGRASRIKDDEKSIAKMEFKSALFRVKETKEELEQLHRISEEEVSLTFWLHSYQTTWWPGQTAWQHAPWRECREQCRRGGFTKGQVGLSVSVNCSFTNREYPGLEFAMPEPLLPAKSEPCTEKRSRWATEWRQRGRGSGRARRASAATRVSRATPRSPCLSLSGREVQEEGQSPVIPATRTMP